MQNVRTGPIASQAKSAVQSPKPQYNVNLVGVTRPLRTARVPGLGINWSSQVVPRRHDLEALHNGLHPKGAQLRHKFEHMPQDQLHMRFVTEVSINLFPKKVQRERLRRRWAAAFNEALKSKGYDRHGRKLEPDQGQRGLIGTLEVLVHGPEGLTKPLNILTNHASTVVANIEALQRQDQHQENLQVPMRKYSSSVSH